MKRHFSMQHVYTMRGFVHTEPRMVLCKAKKIQRKLRKCAVFVVATLKIFLHLFYNLKSLDAVFFHVIINMGDFFFIPTHGYFRFTFKLPFMHVGEGTPHET